MSIQYGDRIYIYIDDGRDYILTIQEGKQFSTHRGNILHDEIAGRSYGESVLTTKGNKVYLLPVGIIENIYHMRRSSQIIYPKDLGYILLMLDIAEGNRVIDVGLGSGSMSAAMARLVGNTGRVYAYERREDMISLATQNLITWKLIDRVTIQQRDIEIGFDEKEIDAIEEMVDYDVENDVELQKIGENEWMSLDGMWSITPNGVYLNEGNNSTLLPDSFNLPDSVQAKYDEIRRK